MSALVLAAIAGGTCVEIAHHLAWALAHGRHRSQQDGYAQRLRQRLDRAHR